MIKITFILPQEKMVDLTIKTFEEHNRLYQHAEEEKTEYEASILVTLQPELYVDKLREADILVARGVTALNVKRCLPDMAVVEIPISGQDIISTIIESIKENGNVPIGIVNSVNMVYSASNIAEYFGIKFNRYIFDVNSPEQIAKYVDRALQDGCKVIIGGIDTCEYAAKLGIPSYPLPMGRESIWQAISEAKHNALIRNKERAKAIEFQTVLNYAYEGIIATDEKGRIITFNVSAERILGIPVKEAMGKYSEAVLSDTKLNTLLRNSREYNNEIITYKKHQLSINKIRMTLHGSFIGNIITFQDIATIQKTESIIRNKVYARGHVAKYHFSDIIGNSSCLQEVINMAKVYAKVDSSILIIGETGTGKELLAQSIHNESKRREGPFVAVNCAALAESLLESELFGYVEGAFTGAVKGGKPGLFELAHGGTIFLDEISEIPIALQGRLLRVIQEREVVRLGYDRVIPIDVRIICASNIPLSKQVKKGEFRRDLYYRLNVLTLQIPPLRERKEDIITLVRYFLSIYANSFSKKQVSLSPAAEKLLWQQDWLGNIREIRNLCERLIILNQTGFIAEKDLLTALPAENCSSQSPEKDDQEYYLGDARFREKERIMEALETCGYDKPAAAARLGFSRTTLWRRMKKLSIPFSRES